MAALRDDNLLGAQLFCGIVESAGHRAAKFVIAVEQTEVGHVPAFARHRPVFAREVEDSRRLGDRAGIVLRLPGVDGIDDVGVRLINRNLNRRVVVFRLQLFFHPRENVEILLAQDSHLVAELPLIFRHMQYAGRHYSDMH